MSLGDAVVGVGVFLAYANTTLWVIDVYVELKRRAKAREAAKKAADEFLAKLEGYLAKEAAEPKAGRPGPSVKVHPSRLPSVE